MQRAAVFPSFVRRAAAFIIGSAAPIAVCGCDSGGVGDPCVPEDEYSDTFSGYSVDEVDVESRSLQCQTRLCLMNHFQGRVSCPYGQTSDEAKSDPRCTVPGSTAPVRVAVAPQLLARRAEDDVYCSCRCDGPDKGARYCECPSGFSCERLIPEYGFKAALSGSYCVREGTADGRAPNLTDVCDAEKRNCD